MIRKPYSKYKVFLSDNGIRYKDEACYLGIDASTFSQKINRTKSDFTFDEVKAICKHHNLSLEEYFSD
ncbi:MAG: helix-turn-helix transcriptional regulator [Youngiibacter sp.]|nr:helix-turn-helix transcriptional regulator [Youngiibacter sp.]